MRENYLRMELFVGNLPLTLRNWELFEIFSKYGKVDSVEIVTDFDTKKSRGYGFVRMPDRLAAQEAIKALHGVDIDAGPLVVNEAKFKKGQRADKRSAAASPKKPRPSKNYPPKRRD